MIQSILFNKKLYNQLNAEYWLKSHKYNPIKPVHITKNYFRYRLQKPNEQIYKYRIKHFNDGIKAVIGFKI